MSKHADLSDDERLAVKRAMATLVVAYGSQVAVGAKLGCPQGTVQKAVKRGEAGYYVRDLLLQHLGISRDELLNRYGPKGSFIGDVRAPGFEGRSLAVKTMRARGAHDDALRIIVTDPAFNRPALRALPTKEWASKIAELHRVLTGKPLPSMPEKGAKFGWDADQQRTVVESASPKASPPETRRKHA